MYDIKTHKKINLITTLSYSKNFNVEKYAEEYLTFMFNSSLILFLPVICLSILLQYMEIETQIDFWLLFVLLFLWIGLGYKKSQKLQ